MAEKKIEDISGAVDDGKEEIFIPKGAANDEPNLFVSVNGVNYLLPKGKKSRVPHHIADEVKRAWEAEEKLDELKAALLEAASASK